MSAPLHAGIHTPSRQIPPKQTPPGQDTPLGRHPPGRHPPRQIPLPPDTTGHSQQVGGTHPTGMHACIMINTSFFFVVATKEFNVMCSIITLPLSRLVRNNHFFVVCVFLIRRIREKQIFTKNMTKEFRLNSFCSVIPHPHHQTQQLRNNNIRISLENKQSSSTNKDEEVQIGKRKKRREQVNLSEFFIEENLFKLNIHECNHVKITP